MVIIEGNFDKYIVTKSCLSYLDWGPCFTFFVTQDFKILLEIIPLLNFYFFKAIIFCLSQTFPLDFHFSIVSSPSAYHWKTPRCSETHRWLVGVGVQSHGEAEAFLQVDEKWREPGAYWGEMCQALACL